MKAITLYQPWATLVAIGEKTYETRSWKTDYRGELAIHSSKYFSKGLRKLCLQQPFIDALHGYLGPSLNPNKQFWFGYILAICEMVDCIPTKEIRRNLHLRELSFGDYSDGRFAWQLKLIKLLDSPVSARGFQGLWNWNQPAK
jgi:hypothetical protein